MPLHRTRRRPDVTPVRTAAPEVQPWRYLDRSGGRRPPRRRRAAVLGLASVLCAAIALALPRLAVAVGRPAAVTEGQITPRWVARAAFVHPGTAVPLPAGGRLVSLRAEGLAAAGATLARYLPTPGPTAGNGLPGWARWNGDAARAVAGPEPAWRPSLLAALCLRAACANSAAAEQASAVRVVGAPQAGWFYPGWDPLATLSLPALADLPPAAVLQRPVPLRPGALLAAGSPVGVLGAPWDAVLLCLLPDAARPELGGVRAEWPGGQPVGLQLAGTGPDVLGHFLAAFSVTTPGPVPGPPARFQVTLLAPAVTGSVVPAGAVLRRRGGARVLTVSGRGRVRVVPVQVLASGERLDVVAGLSAGDRVLSHPAFAARLAGSP